MEVERADAGTMEGGDVGKWARVNVGSSYGDDVDGENGAKCWTCGGTTRGDGYGRQYIPSGFTRDGITLRDI